MGLKTNLRRRRQPGFESVCSFNMFDANVCSGQTTTWSSVQQCRLHYNMCPRRTSGRESSSSRRLSTSFRGGTPNSEDSRRQPFVTNAWPQKCWRWMLPLVESALFSTTNQRQQCPSPITSQSQRFQNHLSVISGFRVARGLVRSTIMAFLA